MGTFTRLVTEDDAASLNDLVCRNRDFLAPWEPFRTNEYYTVAGQLAGIQNVLARCEQETTLPHVILNTSGEVVGRITLNGIVRGPLQSCSVGYWVDEIHNGRGLATAALHEMVQVAFTDLGLHRVQAETLIDNAASQKVLERNGFVRFGLAPKYLHIAGEWRDHFMFHRVNDEHRFQN